MYEELLAKHIANGKTATASATNDTATVTLAATDGKSYHVTRIVAGFQPSAATDVVLVSVGGTGKGNYPVVNVADYDLSTTPIHGNDGQAITAAIGASGAASTLGYVTVHYYEGGPKGT